MQRYKSTINLPESPRGEVHDWPDNARTAVLVGKGILIPEHPADVGPPVTEIEGLATDDNGLWTGDGVIDASNEASYVPHPETPETDGPVTPTPDVDAEPIVEPQL